MTIASVILKNVTLHGYLDPSWNRPAASLFSVNFNILLPCCFRMGGGFAWLEGKIALATLGQHWRAHHDTRHKAEMEPYTTVGQRDSMQELQFVQGT